MKKKLGEMVRKARKDCGLTQEVLALQCNISKPTLVSLERGQGNVSLDTLAAVLAALSLDIGVGAAVAEKPPTLADIRRTGLHRPTHEHSSRAGFGRKRSTP